MGRTPSVRWDQKSQAWTSEVGEPWIDSSGRRRRRAVQFPGGPRDREQALAAMLAYRRRAEALEADPAGSLTVREVCLAYLSHVRRAKLPRTYQGHKDALQAWCRHVPAGQSEPIRARQARLIGSADLQEWIDSLVSRGRSPHYIARLASSVKACWRWAAAEDRSRAIARLVPSDRILTARTPPIPRSPARYATASEVDAFLRWLRARVRTRSGLAARIERNLWRLVCFCYLTGCRPDEAARAEWAHVELERSTIRLRGKLTSRTGRDRTIYLTPPVARMVSRMRARPIHPTHLFGHRRRSGPGRRADGGQSVSPWADKALTHRVCQLRTEAIGQGVPLLESGPNAFTLYRLRHTRISDQLMRGGQIHDVAAANDTSVRMIERVYGHLLDDHLSDLVARLARPKSKSRPDAG